jgi:hypothetical protein
MGGAYVKQKDPSECDPAYQQFLLSNWTTALNITLSTDVNGTSTYSYTPAQMTTEAATAKIDGMRSKCRRTAVIALSIVGGIFVLVAACFIFVCCIVRANATKQLVVEEHHEFVQEVKKDGDSSIHTDPNVHVPIEPIVDK